MSAVNIRLNPAMALSLAAGVFFGAFFWLWSAYGTEVVLGYLQGIALACF